MAAKEIKKRKNATGTMMTVTTTTGTMKMTRKMKPKCHQSRNQSLYQSQLRRSKRLLRVRRDKPRKRQVKRNRTSKFRRLLSQLLVKEERVQRLTTTRPTYRSKERNLPRSSSSNLSKPSARNKNKLSRIESRRRRVFVRNSRLRRRRRMR